MGRGGVELEKSGTVKRLVVSHVRRRGNRRVVDGWRRRGRRRGGRGRETYLRDADELTHVPHALRARLSSLPEEFSGRARQNRSRGSWDTSVSRTCAASSGASLRAVAVEAVPARMEFQDDVRPRAREWQWLKAERAHVWSVDAGARPQHAMVAAPSAARNSLSGAGSGNLICSPRPFRRPRAFSAGTRSRAPRVNAAR